MTSGFIDDLRQTSVIMRHEFHKYVRGKKLFAFIILIAAILAIFTLARPLAGTDFPSESKDFMNIYIVIVQILAIIAVAVFSSNLLVSEYEERTGLLLFTRPIKKGAIFTGKFLAGFIMSTVLIVVYYLIVAILSQVITGAIFDKIWLSLGLMVLFIFGATGLAFFFGSVFKRSSSSIVVTILALILIGQMVAQIFAMYSIEPWFSLSYASSSITTVFTGATTSVVHTSLTGTIWSYVPDVTLSAMVMICWGIFTLLFAFMAYNRKSF